MSVYEIKYFSDREMTMPQAGFDPEIGDWALRPEYLRALRPNEVAVAWRKDAPSAPSYGYDGAWHDAPPPEYTSAQERAAYDARAAAEQIASDQTAARTAFLDRLRIKIDRQSYATEIFVTIGDGDRQVLSPGECLDAIRLLTEAGDANRAGVYRAIAQHVGWL